MKATIYIGLDGSVSTFDTRGIRMPALTGDLSVIHHIIDNYKRPYCKIDKDVRIINPDIYIRNDITGDRMKVDISTLENWATFVTKPKKLNKPQNLQV